MAKKIAKSGGLTGKKLYAVRNDDGTFGEIQEYKKAVKKTLKSKAIPKKGKVKEAPVKKVAKQTAGKKLYAVRNDDGTFGEIQEYKKAKKVESKRKSEAKKDKPEKDAKKNGAKKKVLKKSRSKKL